jgi:hypothetical protein
MEATCSSETPVDFQQTTRRYIPEDNTPHNLKSYKRYVFWKNCIPTETRSGGFPCRSANHYKPTYCYSSKTVTMLVFLYIWKLITIEQCWSWCTQSISRFSGHTLVIWVLSQRWQKKGNSSVVLWYGETKGWHIVPSAGTVTSREKWITTFL